MSIMYGKTKNWLMWLGGFLCALVFGSSGCEKNAPPPTTKYGAPPMPVKPPPPAPDKVPAAGDLESSADWKAISDAWAFATPLAESGKSTETQRKQAKEKMAAARAAAGRLVKSGLLSTAEEELLAAESGSVVEKMLRNPPEPEPGGAVVVCYATLPAVPARDSLERLNARLPILTKLAAQKSVTRPVIDKTLATIESDLATLSDEKKLSALAPEERVGAAKTRDAVRVQVEKLKALLNPAAEPASTVKCYDRMELPPPKPQSARQLDERQAMLDSLEQRGRLSSAAAGKARSAIDAGRKLV